MFGISQLGGFHVRAAAVSPSGDTRVAALPKAAPVIPPYMHYGSPTGPGFVQLQLDLFSEVVHHNLAQLRANDAAARAARAAAQPRQLSGEFARPALAQPVTQQPVAIPPGTPLGQPIPTAGTPPSGPAISIEVIPGNQPIQSAGQMQQRPGLAMPSLPPTSIRGLVFQALKQLAKGEARPAIASLLLAKLLYNLDKGISPSGNIQEFFVFTRPYVLGDSLTLAMEESKKRIPEVLNWIDP